MGGALGRRGPAVRCPRSRSPQSRPRGGARDSPTGQCEGRAPPRTEGARSGDPAPGSAAGRTWLGPSGRSRLPTCGGCWPPEPIAQGGKGAAPGRGLQDREPPTAPRRPGHRALTSPARRSEQPRRLKVRLRRRRPGPEAPPPPPAPRPPARGPAQRGRWPPARPRQLIRRGHLPGPQSGSRRVPAPRPALRPGWRRRCNQHPAAPSPIFRYSEAAPQLPDPPPPPPPPRA